MSASELEHRCKRLRNVLEDGTYRVMADHLQVPDGLGRALENRIGVSRAFPELFRSMRTERLAGFFKKLLDCLDGLQAEIGADAARGSSRAASGEGRVVMFASGPDSPRRAEDALLARYLGIPLVENDDLAVRNLQVYMKTLMGLKNIAFPVKGNADSLRLLGKMRSDMAFSTIEEIIKSGLHEKIEEMQKNLCDLGTQIWKDFFC